MKYLMLEERTDLIRKEMATFPTEFGLRGFPGKRFRISIGDSYVTQEQREGGAPDDYKAPAILLYTHVFSDERGEWLAFAKGTPSELRKEVTE